ncbi:MAG: prepilin peptidase [Candidatus Andeanibacterium colombiense]|uniref:Prepilin peptidase n=1 Tax=Candidatus Andeanibacterium colombiense TaxID=3121345 RepID=A0AAJ6BPK6_9SPHN|nr:MAG: prepilin peptidase [Sphingomonadaceae bacterium]
MQDALIQYVLLAMLAIGLLIAAFTDIRSRQIANWLNIAIALGAPLYWWASGIALWPDVAIQLGVAAATFAALAILFALRAMGGGDVKLLAALALWIPPLQFLNLLVIMALVGGVLALTFGAWHIARHRRDRLAIPYGVAIATGGLWVLAANYLDAARASFGAAVG